MDGEKYSIKSIVYSSAVCEDKDPLKNDSLPDVLQKINSSALGGCGLMRRKGKKESRFQRKKELRHLCTNY